MWKIDGRYCADLPFRGKRGVVVNYSSIMLTPQFRKVTAESGLNSQRDSHEYYLFNSNVVFPCQAAMLKRCIGHTAVSLSE